jgi:hypothetical protein
MKPKSIEDLLQRVKAWPLSAQADLAQVALGIEAELERGAYDSYTPTIEEGELLERRCSELDDGTVEPIGYAELKAIFAKYRP